MEQRLWELEAGAREEPPGPDIDLLEPLEPSPNQLSLERVLDLTEEEPVIELRFPEEVRLGFPTSSRWQLATKRGIDIVGASVLLVLFSPVMLITALAIALTSPGPVFFRQDRVGYMGECFRFLKFRSMCHDAEARKTEIVDHNHHTSGPIFKVRDDPRTTAVGRFIRRFSIDELPQLFHVLSGKMSLVGPRPLPYEDVIAQIPMERLADQSVYGTWDLRRLTTRPGITCIWQVGGRSELDYQTWVAMDRHYLENWSLWLDLKLLAKTVPAVLSGRGAY